MKHALLSLLLLMAQLPLLLGCINAEDYAATPRGDFEALWQIIDEHYCFFDYKQTQYGLDWDSVYERYAPQFHDKLSLAQRFEILSKMTHELRDGHVNLSLPHNVARYTAWYEDHRANFYDSLAQRYLGTASEHFVSSQLRYRKLANNIGYIRCESFDGDIGEGNLHAVMSYLAPCDGLIVDVRNNPGGKLTSAQALASIFTNQPIVVGYISHKTGPDHSDFSPLKALTLRPAQGLRWQKAVVVLANRRTYSAANAFVMYLKALPQATIIGDQTGGGSGMPFSAELPSGIGVRFSASPLYDAQGEHTEFGIAPDIRQDITPDDYDRGVDSIIERAIAYLRSL